MSAVFVFLEKLKEQLDTAMQALYLMALEPVSETTADNYSFGFRKDRSTADAMAQPASHWG